MNILLIPDKFKGSLSAMEAINALSKGIHKNSKNHKIKYILASDGGDGFLAAIEKAKPDLKIIKTDVVDAVGNSLKSFYLFEENSKTAFIELAQTSGLSMLNPKDRDCKYTSTYGTGLQIKDAVEKGSLKIFIGLGGSATNDGGTGIARALGVQFLDKDDNNIKTNGSNLGEIDRIILSDSIIKNTEIIAVNDVINPLLGKTGATYTYALQKGAGKKELPVLERGMKNLFDIISQNGSEFTDTPGFGAAGGTSFGLFAFTNAKIILGIDFILKINDFNNILEDSKIDLIITGEGKIDDQTFHGKFIKGIGDRAKKYNIPVIAICGINDLQNYTTEDLGLKQIHTIKTENMSIKESMDNAGELIEDLVSRIELNGYLY